MVAPTAQPHLRSSTRRVGEHSVLDQGGDRRSAHVLIVVQNLPVPFDRRVWLECRALRDAGYRVSVICPRGPGEPASETIEGVSLYKYRPPATGTTKAAYVSEYVHSFIATARLALRIWRRDRFDVLQVCNPPDIFWPLGMLFGLRGVPFVFDHHDLCPELYESKFATRRSAAYRLLCFSERRTFRCADHVISTNESYRRVAIDRGTKRPQDVTIVRTGPDPDRMRPGPVRSELRRGRPHLVVYLGVMGSQDGVDLAVRAAEYVVHTLGRTDVSFTFIGDGESLGSLVGLRDQLGLKGVVEFTGRVSDDQVDHYLSSADLGLCPDPKNALNDVSTMNKTMEYMAYGLAVLAFNLSETRVSAGDAAAYAEPNGVEGYGDLLVALLDDEPRRRQMGERGRTRVVERLAWSRQSPAYVGVFDALVPAGSASLAQVSG